MTRIVGVDPSYTSTGVAGPHGTFTHTTSTAQTDVERCMDVAAWVPKHGTGNTVFVIEGGVNRSHNALRSGYLHGIIRAELFRLGYAWIDVPPAVVKKYATGRGNAPKVDVVVAARDRLGYEGTDDNEADALWLRQIGLMITDQDHVRMPAPNRKALDGLREDWEDAA